MSNQYTAALRKTFRGHRYVTLRIQDALALLDTIERLEREAAVLLAEREKLLNALEWYSKPENYEHPYVWKRDEYMQSAAELDDGERARQALAAYRSREG